MYLKVALFLGLTLHPKTKFQPFPNTCRKICKQQIKDGSNDEFLSLIRVENIVGKGENAGYWHFLLFPQCFQKASFSSSFKSGLCG